MPQSISRLQKHLRDLIDYWRAFRRQEYTELKVHKVNTDDYITAARKLHAEVYLDRKFVKPKDIVNGFLTSKIDSYYKHSQYFVVTNKKTGAIIATARQINAINSKGHNSFAMFKHTPLYKRSIKLITRHDPVDCVEISGLAKHRGVSKIAPLLLYRAMWQHSVEQKHKLWLLACDYRLFVRLKLLFGPAIQKAGRASYYLGSNSVPAILNVPTSLRAMNRAVSGATFYERWLRRRVTRFMLNGLDESLLSESERKALAELRKKI
ncbi:MAG TPA: hypothetical protein VLA88_00440 [Candidatus Saccharimonadales bacterium]|nr:hypothetical protein [Candidatus Saccharimonadales bacterium]